MSNQAYGTAPTGWEWPLHPWQWPPLDPLTPMPVQLAPLVYPPEWADNLIEIGRLRERVRQLEEENQALRDQLAARRESP